VLTVPLLVGLDGEQKMSKSLGNYIGIKDTPADQFGKVMSIKDELLPMYFRHATAWDPDRIDEAVGALEAGALHPNAAKRSIGRAVVDLYHGEDAGGKAEAEFDRMFKEHKAPSDMASYAFAPGVEWPQVLVETKLATFKREAVRKLNEGAVRCDGDVVRASGVVPNGEHVIQAGKRNWARITVG
jgi:tyrosyl-tRNA synthetase